MAKAEALSHRTNTYGGMITLARIRGYSGRPHLALHILAALARVAPLHLGGVDRLGDIAGGRNDFQKPNRFAGPSADAERSLRDPLARPEPRPGRVRKGGGRHPQCREHLACVRIRGRPIGRRLDPLDRRFPPPWPPGPAARPLRFPSASTVSASNKIPAPKPNPPRPTSSLGLKRAAGGCCCPGLDFHPAPECSLETPPEPARTETGIAALARGGNTGDSRDGFFVASMVSRLVLYRHCAVLDTLCHRMRTLLGTAGEIRREEGESTSHADKPSEASNAARPRSGPSDRPPSARHDRGPRTCAAFSRRQIVCCAHWLCSGATSATVAAETLHMPLRTVQAVLQELVSEGACTIE